MREHFLRWKAVELVCGRRPGDPRNHKKKMRGDAVWEEAAKLVAGTDAEASAETVRKSHALDQARRRRAGHVAELQARGGRARSAARSIAKIN